MNIRIDFKFVFNALLLTFCLLALGFLYNHSYKINKLQNEIQNTSGKTNGFNQQLQQKISSNDRKILELVKETTTLKRQINGYNSKIAGLTKQVAQLNKLNAAYKSYSQALYLRLNEMKETLLNIEQFSKNLTNDKHDNKGK